LNSDSELIKHYKELLHEIKSPLDIIKAHALYLKKNINKEPDITEEYISIILDETERLETFLQEIGESIKSVSLKLSECNVNGIIKDVTKKLEYMFKEKNITLKYNPKKELPKVYLDENRISQVLINLINNAIYAVEPGGTIEIAADVNELFCIKVKDDGCGIEKGDINNIFDPFYTKKPEGSGLGLYITKKIIDAHGGSINVTSELNKGAEFLVILPASHKEKGENV
jgi:signal transduction histidine kinase